MGRGKSGWFSPQELEYLYDSEAVAPKHRSTVRDRIENTVNEEVIHDLERIPELPEFLNSTARETLNLQTEPARVSKGLGELYSGQLADLIYGILLSEREPDESVDEFVDRFDAIWEDIGADVRHRIQNTQSSFEVRRIFQTFRRDLLEEVIGHVEVAYYLWDVKARIPVDEFVEWTVAQKGEMDFDYLPEIFDMAFGITVDDPMPRRFVDYWNLLTNAATDSDIHPPDDTGWAIDYEDPSAREYELHETALSALDDELRNAAHRFWEDAQVDERDQLLALGLYSYSKLEPRDKQILDRIPCSNRRDGWNRYDTRRANLLTDDRDLPLLSRETTPKRGTNEKHYEFTDYGCFVHWLTSYVEEKASYSAVLRDFLSDAPADLVDEANDWVTEYTGAARRLDLDVDELRDSTDDEGAREFGPLLSNAVLWFRVFKVTDDSEWEDG